MRRALAILLVAVSAAGCSTSVQGHAVRSQAASVPEQERDIIARYFDDLNASGADGPSVQRDFLRRTQHPDYNDRFCDLGGLVLAIEPALSTLRADAKWKPEKSTKRPRGAVYVVGVSVKIRRDSATLAEQIGSQRVVVLDGKAYGFTPCPTE